MKTFLACIVGAGLLASVTAAEAAERAIIVLDASGSMWGQIGGEAKIAIARSTLGKVLTTLPDNLELGFMAYGHRDKGSCTDIQMIIPAGPGTGGAIIAAAEALTPKGKTPISDAVRLAAEELRYTEDKATVILITDGLETCQADPCAVATALEKAGVDFTAHVIGFGTTAEEDKQIACLAENTGGKYLSAGDADKLSDALTTTVVETVTPTPPKPPEPPVEVTKVEQNLKPTSRPAPGAEPFAAAADIRYDVYKATADGREEDALHTGYGDTAFSVPAGRYVVRASKDLAAAETTVEVSEDKVTTAEVILDAGLIMARAMATETEPVAENDGVRWDVTDSNGETDTSYGPMRTIMVGAGEATVTARLGTATTSVPVTVVAGAIEEIDVVLGSGHLVLRGKRSAADAEVADGIRWDVTNAQGETETNYGGEQKFDLAAGDYTIRASLGEAAVEVKITVPAGKTIEREVIVASGKVTAHALFAEGGPVVTASPRFDVLAAEAGADGERKGITTAYNDGATFDLAPGKYVLRATSDAAIAEAGFEVTGGKPLDVSVVLNAGLLAVTAPGGDRLDLISKKKDIYGNQEILATRYGEDWQVAVPAGDFVLKVRKKDESEATTPVTIKAGERTEVAVE